ncbi:hypothetical protein [Paenibacillus larvae]|uniref:hypothetical protein n=1 Tax=Paenibacillus larvae TaxID=1464 RepID=UPI003D2DB60C
MACMRLQAISRKRARAPDVPAACSHCRRMAVPADGSCRDRINQPPFWQGGYDEKGNLHVYPGGYEGFLFL